MSVKISGVGSSLAALTKSPKAAGGTGKVSRDACPVGRGARAIASNISRLCARTSALGCTSVEIAWSRICGVAMLTKISPCVFKSPRGQARAICVCAAFGKRHDVWLSKNCAWVTDVSSPEAKSCNKRCKAGAPNL